MSVKTKIILCCVLLSFITMATGVVSYYSLQRTTKNYGLILQSEMPKLTFSGQMLTHFQTLRVALRTLGLPNLSEAQGAAAIAEVEKISALYEETNKKYLAGQPVASAPKLYQEVDKEWRSFTATGKHIIDLYKSNDPTSREEMQRFFLTECPEHAKAYIAAVTKLIDWHQTDNSKMIEGSEIQTQNAIWIVGLLVIVGWVVSMGIGVAFSNQLARSLQKVVTSLTSGASEVNVAVLQLSSSSNELSRSSARQAAAIQQTTASIEEIRGMVESNSQNAASSLDTSNTSYSKAEQGRKVVLEMIEAMRHIQQSNNALANQVTEGNRKISAIVALIEEIRAKTTVINEIVFQTKILSFNASIEAARAGEQGQGFSVVAREVGTLAQMSGAAANEIETMLQGSTTKVQSIIAETTTQVEKLIAEATIQLERGSDIAQECGHVLEEIVSNVKNVKDRVSDISTGSREQAIGVAEIARAMQDLDSATQLNASEAHQSDHAAGMLANQVDILKDAAGQLQSIVMGRKAGNQVAHFEWQSRYELGVENMDDEHKILVQHINHLVDVLEKHGSKSKKVHPAFTALAEYTREHFADEERFLTSISYPDLQKHQAIHQKLLSQVDQFSQQLHKGELEAPRLVQFLNDWLIQHILGVDMKYARFFNEKRATDNKGLKLAS